MSENFFKNLGKDKKKEIPPVPSPTITPSTVQRTPRKSTTTITKNDLQTFKDDVLKALKQTIPQASELEEIGLIHTFSRKNLISFIGRRGVRGTKLCELRDFFYPTPAGEIDKEIQKIRKEGIIKKNRNGWMSLRKKQ